MTAQLVDFEERLRELVREGRHPGLQGGRVISRDGGVTIEAPAVRDAALLVHKNRTPEFNDHAQPVCTRCRNGDIVIVVGFPGGDGEPLQFCRGCLDRPPGKPLVIQFRA